ncbi:hypothetical protein GPECTOR_357g124 [Gonium pectorale]|uniref:Fibronectin type-II domain-containing protein n=1 Tax=Gonium pectorale TaxID=33097 RepID=A0A150FVH3_GONPE|nr:hypothetical protein GPECTOR_357g124 [Gonium pectorale]|eukprot:KXZ41621.1 hypothetical protein GPECTOR_357g124 [Gonium pectorale]
MARLLLGRSSPSGSGPVGSGGLSGGEVDGGDPLFLGGPLLLCGRYGGAASRAYGGQLANLAVFDTALTGRQVELLYNMVANPSAVPAPSLPLRRHPWYGSTLLTPPEWLAADQSDAALSDSLAAVADRTGGGAGGAAAVTPAAEPSAAGDNTTALGSALDAAAKALSAALAAALGGVSYNGSAGSPCSLDLRRQGGLSFCQQGLVCAPFASPTAARPATGRAAADASPAAGAAADALASASALLGVCAPPAAAMLLPASWPSDWPAPAAHFPLTRGSLRSWPGGVYGGRAVNATWEPDTRFGAVLRCDRFARSAVLLDPVPYGGRGPLAVNLWVRTSRGDLAPGGDGSMFQYILSHMAEGPFSSFGPNQIQIYVPELGSPLYGVSARAFLRDGEDTYSGRASEVWLDSDGSVGNDEPRKRARDARPRSPSPPRTGPGFALFVDGVLRGELRPGAVRTTANASDTAVELCVLPFVVDNVTYTDCVRTDGLELCPTAQLGAGGDLAPLLLECAPLVARPPDSTRCRDEERAAAAAATRNFSQCVNTMGIDSCQTEDGLWVVCPPPARTTVNGQTCKLPFTLGPLMRSDCVLPPNSSAASAPSAASAGFGGSGRGSSREVCALADGGLADCLPTYVPPPTLQPRFPIRYTLDRQRCLAPGPGALSECLDYSEGPGGRTDAAAAATEDSLGEDGGGRYMCQVEGGSLLECAPVERATLAAGPLPPQPCAFPFLHAGRNRTDCVWLYGVEACKVADGSWAECSPLFRTVFPEPPPNITLTDRHTVTGQPCALPFFYDGSLRWDCVGAGIDPGYCRGRNGSWEQCMPRAQGGRPSSEVEMSPTPHPHGAAFARPSDEPAPTPAPATTPPNAGLPQSTQPSHQPPPQSSLLQPQSSAGSFGSFHTAGGSSFRTASSGLLGGGGGGLASAGNTGASAGASAGGGGAPMAPVRPPRPAPPPPFPRGAGGNAFAAGQLSPAASFRSATGTSTGGDGGAVRSP